MKKKILYSLLICLFWIGTFVAGFFTGSSTKSVEIVHDTIAPQIEKYYITNDSLSRINDSINIKVIEIEKTYEKTVDDIIRNNLGDDYDFFSAYTARYCGYYNTDSTKNCELDIR